MNELALPPEQQALENIKGKVEPEDFKTLQNFITKNVIELGTDKVFTLRDKEGRIKAFKQKVYLSVDDGTLWKLPAGKQGNEWVYKYPITALGFDRLAEATGSNVILPHTVIVDGHEQPNPHVFRHEQGHIQAVYARAVAFRFSSKGIPQVADWTTIFDLRTYRVVDLIAKAKKIPQAFKVLPVGTVLENDDKSTWANYVLDSSTSLFVNTSHPEALEWYKGISKREQKAVDTGQTFARRNALKHLIGIQDAPKPQHTMTVLCWRPIEGSMVKWDMTQYEQLQETVTGVIKGKDAPKKLEMSRGEETIEGDEVESELDPEDQEVIEIEPVEEKPEKKELVPETEEEKKLVKEVNMIQESFPEEYQEAVDKLNLVGQEIGFPEMAQILKKVNQILDEQAG